MKNYRLKRGYGVINVALFGLLVAGCSADKDSIAAVSEAVATDTVMDSIVVYSSRKEHLKTEGQNSPADLLITVDAGNLGYAAAEGIFQPMKSAVINQNIAAHLRDDKDLWTGLSLRARTIVYSTERVRSSDLSTYQAIGQNQWQGRVCLRTSKKV